MIDGVPETLEALRAMVPPSNCSFCTRLLRQGHCMQAIASRAQDTSTPAIVFCCCMCPVASPHLTGSDTGLGLSSLREGIHTGS